MPNLTITSNGAQIINITAGRISPTLTSNGALFSCANVTAATGSLTRSYPSGSYTSNVTVAGVPYTGRWLIIRDSPGTHLSPGAGRSIRVLLSNRSTRPTLT